jgi:hypothetical protein
MDDANLTLSVSIADEEDESPMGIDNMQLSDSMPLLSLCVIVVLATTCTAMFGFSQFVSDVKGFQILPQTSLFSFKTAQIPGPSHFLAFSVQLDRGFSGKRRTISIDCRSSVSAFFTTVRPTSAGQNRGTADFTFDKGHSLSEPVILFSTGVVITKISSFTSRSCVFLGSPILDLTLPIAGGSFVPSESENR